MTDRAHQIPADDGSVPTGSPAGGAPAGGAPTDGLVDLPFDELRERAFARAESHHDVRFFWDLFKHLPERRVVATDDGSPTGASGSLVEASGGLFEAIGTARRMFRDGLGDELGDAEPLIRARLVEYLREHGGR